MKMPVARYFMVVGGALLALLFLIDAYAPSEAITHAAPAIDRTVVRIRSEQKLPERVVYDTSLPTIVPPAATRVAAAPLPPVARDVAAETQVRDTFAQYVPAAVKKPEPPVQRKRKVARSHPSQPMRFAQQQHFGFWGYSTW